MTKTVLQNSDNFSMSAFLWFVLSCYNDMICKIINSNDHVAMIRFMLVHLILSDLGTPSVPGEKSEADHLAEGQKPPYLAWTHLVNERRTWNELIFTQLICKLWHLVVRTWNKSIFAKLICKLWHLVLLCWTTHAASENLSSLAHIAIFKWEFSKEILPNTEVRGSGYHQSVEG